MPPADDDPDPRPSPDTSSPTEGVATADPRALRPRLARIARELAAYEADRKRLMATSSFQSNSVVLLHVLSRFAPRVLSTSCRPATTSPRPSGSAGSSPSGSGWRSGT